MKVFLAGTSFRPSYGGPAISVARLAAFLASEGVTVGLWAPDGSAGIANVGESRVQRLDGSLGSAAARFGEIDVIHDNGIWLPHNHEIASLARRSAIARVVSTRGMLEPWAISHKAWKKRIAWWSYQRRDLRTAAALHAATEVEAARLTGLDLGVPVTVIPNGVDMPRVAEHRARSDGRRAALFLGRIYPVKGLPMLIEAWSRVRPRDWVLRIAGPDEGGHLETVMDAVTRAGLTDDVELVGEVAHEDKPGLFAEADLFVSPTHSESFGMAIAEALANGLPVLTTTGAPWPELEATGCGWRVSPTVADITTGLERGTSLPTEVLRSMGSAGREFVARTHQWSAVAARTKTLYQGIMS